MTEAGLHHLQGKFEAAIDTTIDAPRGIEVPQAVQAGVFRLALRRDHAGGHLRRDQAALDDVGEVLDAPGTVGEHQIESALRASELHSRKLLTSRGASGTVRSPLSDLGGPSVL